MKYAFLLLLSFVLFGAQAQTYKPNFEYKSKKKLDYVLTFVTDSGSFSMVLFDETPLHKGNYINLTKQGYFNGIAFHRVLKNFVVQGGDPYTKIEALKDSIGSGGPGFTIPAEIRPELKHDKYNVGAARMGDDVNPKKESSGSQFYVVQRDKGTPHLDGNYTVFGKVIKGQEVIDRIALAKVNKEGKPYTPILIQKVELEFIKKTEIEAKYGYTFPVVEKAKDEKK